MIIRTSPPVFAFQTKTSDRWSDQLTPAGVRDMALRGTEAQWWELYRTAQNDSDLRELLRRLLTGADPELLGGQRLWKALLKRMEEKKSDRVYE